MKRRKTSGNNYKEDRISRLPDHLLHHILSYLPTKDAAKTSVLSKTWNSVWKSFPILDFNFYSFQQSALSRNKNRKKLIQDFCDYVDQSIANRCAGDTCIERFHLVSNFTGKYRHKNVDRWLNYAIDNNVRHLRIAYHSNTISQLPYNLPPSLFRATSLQTLDLFRCNFKQLTPDCAIQFSLTKLKLSRVYIHQETLQNMLSKCQLLEELHIDLCTGFQSVRVAGTKLETVDLYLDRDDVQTVAVSAPNLRSLSYAGGFANVESSFMASECYENVRELTLHDVSVTDDFFRVLEGLPRLEKLNLKTCCTLERIRICSKVVELSISQCVQLETIELDFTNVGYFRFDDVGKYQYICRGIEGSLVKFVY